MLPPPSLFIAENQASETYRSSSATFPASISPCAGFCCSGDGQADHYHWRKGFPYEFASHVPWMLRWPKNDPRSAAWERGDAAEIAQIKWQHVANRAVSQNNWLQMGLVSSLRLFAQQPMLKRCSPGTRPLPERLPLCQSTPFELETY